MKLSEIHLNRVTKHFGSIIALDDVSCTINEGAFSVIFGPSGCGKSTLLRVIAGLDGVDGGELSIGGVPMLNVEAQDRGCAMVFQDYALYPHMTVAGNIEYPLKLMRLPKSDRQYRIAEIAELLDIRGQLNRLPSQLSGGQRQRTAIARAVAKRPRILLLDEPLSNLDSQLRADTRAEFRRLHRQLGMTIVYVTHDYVEAMTLADEVHVMENGRLLQSSTSDAIYDRPNSMSIARSFGSPQINLLGGVIRGPTSFALIDGQEINLRGHPFDDGAELVLGVRPESIKVSNSGEGLKIACTDVENRGSVFVLRGLVGETEVRILSARPDAVTRGDTIGAEIDLENILYFDAGTKELIASNQELQEKGHYGIAARRAKMPRSAKCFLGDFGGPQPDCVGRKFTLDGRGREFSGNTILFQINAASDLIRHIGKLTSSLQQAPEHKHFSFLPPETYHVTLLDCIEFDRLCDDQYGGFQGMTGDQTTAQIRSIVEHNPRIEPVQMRPVRLGPSRKGGLLLYVEGATKHDESILRKARDRLADELNLRRGNHEHYLFHITLAYQFSWLSRDEADLLMKACQALSKQILEDVPSFTVNQAIFSEYSSMASYSRIVEIGEKGPV